MCIAGQSVVHGAHYYFFVNPLQPTGLTGQSQFVAWGCATTVCVREREIERGRERGREGGSERESHLLKV